MLQNIIYQQDMASDFESDWVPIIAPSNEARKRISSNAILFNWTDVNSENFDGKITIIGAGESKLPAIGSEIIVNSSDNSDDCWFIKLSNYVSFLKIKYNKNSTISGKLTVIIEYSF